MAILSNKIRLTNDTSRTRVIWVEPWGADFALAPGEWFEITATGVNFTPYFNIVDLDDGTQVFVEGPDPMQTDYTVSQVGRQVAVDHDREK